MILDFCPDDREPVELTHYDCWGDGDETPVGLWSMTEEEVQRFFAELLEDWAKRYNMPEIVDLSNIMPEVGLTECMKVVSLSFDARGFDVYDGDEFFEVYKPERG